MERAKKDTETDKTDRQTDRQTYVQHNEQTHRQINMLTFKDLLLTVFDVFEALLLTITNCQMKSNTSLAHIWLKSWVLKYCLIIKEIA